MDFDFIVVGAGPIGSYIAKSLVKEGFSAGVFERKKEVGEGVICSGIIGKDAYDKFSLPPKAVIREISSLKVFSPSLIELDYSKEESFAYIVDRKKFDKELVKEALKEGAELFLESNVSYIERTKEKILIRYSRNKQEFQKSARCLIIATGTNFNLHKKIGLSAPMNILWGNRVKATGGHGDGKESVEVYILSEPDLSSFGWIIPFNGHARIGVLSGRNSLKPLEKLIYKSNGRFKINMNSVERAPIACGNSNKIAGERVIAVGEAAGQVKTTTGGGISYGLIGASIASEILLRAAGANDFSANSLKEYEDIWSERMGDEIRNGIMVRNVVTKIAPCLVDDVFDFLKKNPSIKEELANSFHFDYHKGIIKSGIKFFLNKIPDKLSSFTSLFK